EHGLDSHTEEIFAIRNGETQGNPTHPGRDEGSMKIGSQTHRSSAISSSNESVILVRGKDLCAALIGSVSFTDHIWLLVVGELPSAGQRAVLDATLVAIAEHGL